MAPLGLTCVSRLAKSFCSSTLARCTSVLPAPCIILGKYLSSQAGGPPKRPLNGYMLFVKQQRPIFAQRYPDVRMADLAKMIGEEWKQMSPEQKQPFQLAFLRAKEQFNVDLQKYQALVTPEELEQHAQEKRQRQQMKAAGRKKKETISLGKPKRSRSPFNIYMSEHYEEARGAKPPERMASLLKNWRNLFSQQKQVYLQLSEDDKIRFKNEMNAWEDHMLEIGREDLIRKKTMRRKAKKSTDSASAEEVAGTGESDTTGETTDRSAT